MYVKGEITVRTVNCSAVVEAKAGSNTFSKKYPLPPDTNVEAVVAAMSDEGIMTITAPKVNYYYQFIIYLLNKINVAQFMADQ